MYVFISGIPASGKSYLANKLSKETGVFHLNIDHLRRQMKKDPQLKYWVNFYWDLDEEKYYHETSCEQQWENLKNQSEAFWPFVLKRIKEVMEKHDSAIFEAVNILPHLAKKDLDFSGVYLLGKSFEQIFERNKKNPRWGNTEEFQRLEAENFFFCERPKYKEEAKKYGYKTFTNSHEAEVELLGLLKKS